MTELRSPLRNPRPESFSTLRKNQCSDRRAGGIDLSLRLYPSAEGLSGNGASSSQEARRTIETISRRCFISDWPSNDLSYFSVASHSFRACTRSQRGATGTRKSEKLYAVPCKKHDFRCGESCGGKGRAERDVISRGLQTLTLRRFGGN